MLRISGGRVVRAVPVRGLHVVLPTNLAFGDGHAYVGRAGGEVDAVSLGTGALSTHRPARTLAKGGRIVATRWLGRHRLGVGSDVVNTRTWHAEKLVPGARGIAAGPGVLVAYGKDGAEVVRGETRTRVLASEPISEGWIDGGYFYAAVEGGTEVVDLRTGASVATVPGSVELVP